MCDRHRVALVMFGIGWGANHFTGLLLVYRRDAGLSAATVAAMFGAYALGLIPTLFAAGALSDRIGRRRVLRPAIWLSLLASAVLAVGIVSPWLLFLGRFLAGVATGAAMVVGTAWVRQLAQIDGVRTGARLAAVALSGGFGSGPLSAGVLAQWLPWPRILPYVVHIALMLTIVTATRHIAEPKTEHHGDAHPQTGWARRLVTPPFLLGVGIWAPWVFGTATVSFAVLPTLAAVANSAKDAPVFFNGALAGLTLLTGVSIQPFAQRLTHTSRVRGTLTGLLLSACGLAGAAWIAHPDHRIQWWMLLPVAVVLGSAYGTLMVAGLIKVEQLSTQREHAAYVAAYYALTYVGFGVPYGLAILTQHAPLWNWLTLAAVVPLLTMPITSLRQAHPPRGE